MRRTLGCIFNVLYLTRCIVKSLPNFSLIMVSSSDQFPTYIFACESPSKTMGGIDVVVEDDEENEKIFTIVLILITM